MKLRMVEKEICILFDFFFEIAVNNYVIFVNKLHYKSIINMKRCCVKFSNRNMTEER